MEPASVPRSNSAGIRSAAADDNWLVRGRVLHVAPNDSSGAVTGIPGSGVAVRPYAGIGVNYTRFYDEKVTRSLEAALGPTKLEIDSSLGIVGQVGVDLPVGGGRWFVNLDAKYVVMETEATLRSGGVTRRVDIDLNPWFLGLGLGTRF